MQSIFGPEPPPSHSHLGPISRAVGRKPKAPAEVIDTAARQTARQALTMCSELNERFGALTHDLGVIAGCQNEGIAAIRIERDADMKEASKNIFALSQNDEAMNAEITALRNYVLDLKRIATRRILVFGTIIAIAQTAVLLAVRFAL